MPKAGVEPSPEETYGEGGHFPRGLSWLERWNGNQKRVIYCMAACLADDKGIMGIGLDVTPSRAAGVAGEITQVNRIHGIGDLDKCGSFVQPDDGKFATRWRIGPAPDVIGLAATYIHQGQEHQKIDVMTRVNIGHAINARSIVHGSKGLS